MEIRRTDTGKLLHTLPFAAGAIYELTYSPDGQYLAARSTDRVLFIWNLAKAASKHATIVASDVVCLAISSDSRFAYGLKDGTVVIRRLNGAEWVQERVLKGQSGPVRSVLFDPQHAAILSTSTDGTIRIWDATSGKTTRVMQSHTAAVNAIALSDDGKQLASASDDLTVRLWDRDSGKLLQTMRGHSHAVRTIAFADDRLWTSSSDGSVRLWELQHGEQTLALTAKHAWPLALSFDRKKQRLVTVWDDRHVRSFETK